MGDGWCRVLKVAGIDAPGTHAPGTDAPTTHHPTLITRLRSCLLMHIPSKSLHVLHRRRGQDAVTEVEDMAGTSARACEDVVGRREDAIQRSEKQRRIEVALNRAVGADSRPGLVQRCP